MAVDVDPSRPLVSTSGTGVDVGEEQILPTGRLIADRTDARHEVGEDPDAAGRGIIGDLGIGDLTGAPARQRRERAEELLGNARCCARGSDWFSKSSTWWWTSGRSGLGRSPPPAQHLPTTGSKKTGTKGPPVPLKG